MKLGKLLAAGKSIMNGRTDISYRSSRQIYLPKFSSPKNPFKHESAGQPVETTPSGAIEPRVSASRFETSAREVAGTARFAGGNTAVSPAPSGSTLLSSQSDLPRQNEVVAGAKAGLPRQSEAAAGAKEGLPRRSEAKAGPPANPQPAVAAVQTARIPQMSKFNPFSILRGALPGGKAKNSVTMAKGQKGTPTQAELSLDSVRVVHNDLSDVDVEVVPIKSRSSVPDLPAPKNSWEFVGERLFGVEAT